MSCNPSKKAPNSSRKPGSCSSASLSFRKSLAEGRTAWLQTIPNLDRVGCLNLGGFPPLTEHRGNIGAEHRISSEAKSGGANAVTHAQRMYEAYSWSVLEGLMPSLQIRAQAHKRSLSQQALVDLGAIAGGDPRERRRHVLDRLSRRGPITPALTADPTPEDLIRVDRER